MGTGDARGWALVVVSEGKDPEKAFEALQKVAIAHEWNASWHIKRIDLVTPLEGFASGAKDARGTYSLIAAVKARDDATLIGAFNEIEKALADFSHVDGFRAGGATYDFNWP